MDQEQLGQVVDRFYAKVRQDLMIGPIFEKAIEDQWDEHLATMRSFWGSVMFASGTYSGNPMAVHLRLPRLARDHFERWLELWRETATEVCPEQAQSLIQRAEAIASRLLAAVNAGAPVGVTLTAAEQSRL